MVVFPKAGSVIPSTNLQKLLYDKELIQVLACQLVAGQVEAHIEMACDFNTEHKDFASVDMCIQGAKETVNDYIEDLLTDFREMLYESVRKVEVTTKNAIFEAEGLKDAEVSVSVKAE